ncbi:hypothetical protein YC2023_111022 [Brassica napus]
MAFGTYLVLDVLSLGLCGKNGWLFFLQVMLLEITLLSLGRGESPLLDIVAYAGYANAGLCLAVLCKTIWGYSYYVLIPWTCLCTGVFLVSEFSLLKLGVMTQAGIITS